MFRNTCARAGLDSGEWTPRELRHCFVSLMSDVGVPVLTGSAQVMDTLFELPGGASDVPAESRCLTECPSDMRKAPRLVG